MKKEGKKAQDIQMTQASPGRLFFAFHANAFDGEEKGMLHIYTCRANTDRKQFIFDQIAKEKKDRRILLLVPDQSTLETERQAFFYLKAQGLMNVEVMSLSRLGTKVLSQTGGPGKTMINDLGKAMLLRKVAAECKDHLQVYPSQCEKQAFLEMLGDLIQELKQAEISWEDLALLLEETKPAGEGRAEPGDPLYLKKLRDVQILYRGYEEALEGRYMDMEDSLSLIGEKLPEAAILKKAVVWVDGFDSCSGKMAGILEQIMKTADELHLVFTACLSEGETEEGPFFDEDLFEGVNRMVKRLLKAGEDLGIPTCSMEIPAAFEGKLCPETAHLEKNLYAYPYGVYLKKPENLHILACGDEFSEAETVAEKIMELVTKGLCRFRDIGVVCADVHTRGAVIRRVLEKWGISCFMDEKHSVMHHPFVQFVLALGEITKWGYRHEDVFRLASTGLVDMSQDERELLENYVLKFDIRGRQWKEPFERWVGEKDAFARERLGELNRSREKISGLVASFEEAMKEAETGGEMARALYGFLLQDARLADKGEAEVERLKAAGAYRAAAETAQIWNGIVVLLRQMLELTGDLKMERELFFEMLSAGFGAIALGVIPTTMDQVLVGDLQRSKTGSLKVVFVLGVNDGILPAGKGKSGIFHPEEKERLAGLGIELSTRDGLRQQEESLSVYKTLSMARESLYLSYTAKDSENTEMKPSLLIDRIKKLFPALKEEKGLYTGGAEETGYRFQSRVNYMLEHEEWQGLLEVLRKGASFRNDKKMLEPEVFSLLYPPLLTMSPTSLETFSRCPFRFFLKFGIRADERRVYQVAAPEMGTMFHRILMLYTRWATQDGLWRNMTGKQCAELIDRAVEETVKDFREGVLFEDRAGRYRISRMKRICGKTAWMVTEHMNRGRFDRFYFETGFGRGQLLPPVCVETEEGQKVLIEGRIDRVDILQEDDIRYVKVIDYKSGNERVAKQEILSGYQMQLMLYMNAVMEALEDKYPANRIRPAGVFYFKIQEPVVDVEKKESLGEEEIKQYAADAAAKEFKMDGIVVNDPQAIEGLDSDFSGYSPVIRMQRKKDGSVRGTSGFAALSPEEFKALQSHVKQMTQTLCRSFAKGNVAVAPKRGEGELTACSFCDYRSICMFDRACAGFEFVR